VANEVGRRAELNKAAIDKAVAELLAEASRHLGRDGHGSVLLKLFATDGLVTGHQVAHEWRSDV
jgi:hypothetical protein